MARLHDQNYLPTNKTTEDKHHLNLLPHHGLSISIKTYTPAFQLFLHGMAPPHFGNPPCAHPRLLHTNTPSAKPKMDLPSSSWVGDFSDMVEVYLCCPLSHCKIFAPRQSEKTICCHTTILFNSNDLSRHSG